MPSLPTQVDFVAELENLVKEDMATKAQLEAAQTEWKVAAEVCFRET